MTSKSWINVSTVGSDECEYISNLLDGVDQVEVPEKHRAVWGKFKKEVKSDFKEEVLSVLARLDKFDDRMSKGKTKFTRDDRELIILLKLMGTRELCNYMKSRVDVVVFDCDYVYDPKYESKGRLDFMLKSPGVDVKIQILEPWKALERAWDEFLMAYLIPTISPRRAVLSFCVDFGLLDIRYISKKTTMFDFGSIDRRGIIGGVEVSIPSRIAGNTMIKAFSLLKKHHVFGK